MEDSTILQAKVSIQVMLLQGYYQTEGFIRLPELKPELTDQILIVNYGESGRKNTGPGGYTIQVTIEFVPAKSHTPICSCTAEGQEKPKQMILGKQ